MSFYSSPFLFSSQPRASYQIYTKKGEEKIAIGLMPKVENIVSMDIPICVLPAIGDKTDAIIEIPNISEFDEEWDVFLIDHYSKDIVDMRSALSYSIPDADILYEDRFSLRLVRQGTVLPEIFGECTSNKYIDENAGVSVLTSDDEVTIVSRTNQKMTITVYDVLGRIVVSQTTQVRITIPLPKNELFLLHIQQGNREYSMKVVI